MSDSLACKVCGETSMDNIDGLMFCSRCGKQCEGIIEKDMEIFGMKGLRKVRSSARKSEKFMKQVYEDKIKDIAESSQQFASLSQSLGIELDSSVLHDSMLQALKTDDMKRIEENEEMRGQVADTTELGKYEEHSMERIQTFSLLLRDLTHQLVEKIKMPKCLKKTALTLFMSYLERNGIFLNEGNKNFDEVKDMFLDVTPYLHKVQSDYSCDNFESRRKWCLKMNGIKLESIMNAESEIDESKLTIADRCNLINLSLNVCVSILYLSILLVGEKWILISDLLRWLRQGVIRVDVAVFLCLQQRYVLNTRIKYKSWIHPILKESMTGKNWKPSILSAVNFNHANLLIFMDYVDIIREPITFDLTRITHRILRNLNLPKCLMSRIVKLYNVCPPKCSKLHPSECWVSLKSNNNILYWIDNVVQHFSGYKKCAIRQPIDAEIMQYILLALGLMFAFDSFSENKLSLAAKEFDSTRMDGGVSFNVCRWLLQCKMRLSVLLGEDVKFVLSSSWTSFIDNPWHNAPVRRILKTQEMNLLQFENSPLPLHSPMNIPDKNLETDHKIDELFLLCPLKYAADSHKNIEPNLKNDSGCDQDNVNLFFHDFYEDDMEFIEKCSGKEHFWNELNGHYDKVHQEQSVLLDIFNQKCSNIANARKLRTILNLRHRPINLWSYRTAQLRLGRLVQKITSKKFDQLHPISQNVRSRYFPSISKKRFLNPTLRLDDADWISSGSEAEHSSDEDIDNSERVYSLQEAVNLPKPQQRTAEDDLERETNPGPSNVNNIQRTAEDDLERGTNPSPSNIDVLPDWLTEEIRWFPCSKWLNIRTDIFTLSRRCNIFKNLRHGLSQYTSMHPFQVRATPNTFEFVGKMFSMCIGTPFNYLYFAYFLLQIKAFHLLGPYLPATSRLLDAEEKSEISVFLKIRLKEWKRHLFRKYGLPLKPCKRHFPRRRWVKLWKRAQIIRKSVDKIVPLGINCEERENLIECMLSEDYRLLYGKVVSD